MHVSCFFVIDNPEAAEPNFERHSEEKEVIVIRNRTNIRTSLSRNRGFEAGTGEYVLFLDDDIEVPSNLLETYFEAICRFPNSPGFVGSVRFPPCINTFTQAVRASDILTFWDLAENTTHLAWGITANLMVKRAAVGDIRFSNTFPKKGGGEDVDYCLRIVDRSKDWFVSVPTATTVHPWWNNGSHQYLRFARWAYGDSSLPMLHPAYKFRNAPNMIETVLIIGGINVLSFVFLQISPAWFAFWLGAVFILELFMDGLRMRLQRKNPPLTVSIQSTFVHPSNDLGRIACHLKHLRFLGITERFDYFMTGEHLTYERVVAISKFVAYASLAIVLFILLNW
jgi:GT2 family glycosyltransferase